MKAGWRWSLSALLLAASFLSPAGWLLRLQATLLMREVPQDYHDWKVNPVRGEELLQPASWNPANPWTALAVWGEDPNLGQLEEVLEPIEPVQVRSGRRLAELWRGSAPSSVARRTDLRNAIQQGMADDPDNALYYLAAAVTESEAGNHGIAEQHLDDALKARTFRTYQSEAVQGYVGAMEEAHGFLGPEMRESTLWRVRSLYHPGRVVADLVDPLSDSPEQADRVRAKIIRLGQKLYAKAGDEDGVFVACSMVSNVIRRTKAARLSAEDVRLFFAQTGIEQEIPTRNILEWPSADRVASDFETEFRRANLRAWGSVAICALFICCLLAVLTSWGMNAVREGKVPGEAYLARLPILALAAYHVAGTEPKWNYVGLSIALFAASIVVDPLFGARRATLGLGIVALLIGMFAMYFEAKDLHPIIPPALLVLMASGTIDLGQARPLPAGWRLVWWRLVLFVLLGLGGTLLTEMVTASNWYVLVLLLPAFVPFVLRARTPGAWMGGYALCITLLYLVPVLANLNPRSEIYEAMTDGGVALRRSE